MESCITIFIVCTYKFIKIFVAFLYSLCECVRVCMNMRQIVSACVGEHIRVRGE